MIGKSGKQLLITTVAALSLVTACSSPEQKLEKYTASGQRFLEEGDLIKANLQFRNALEINEEHVPAIEGQIAIAEENREYALMYGLLQGLVRLQPDNLTALVKMGNIQLLASDELAAQDTVERALAIDPSNLDAQALKSSILFKLGDRAQAIQLARSVLQQNPANQDALSIIVAEKALTNDLDGALDEVSRGLEKDPGNVVLSMMRIELLAKQGRDEEVNAAFRALIAANPDDPAYRQSYARNLLRMGAFEEARPVMQGIVEVTPDDLEARMNVVRLDYQLGGIDRALATFKGYVDERPDDTELQFAYASFLIDQDREDEARAIYEGFAKNRKDKVLADRARVQLASLELRAGNTEAALTTLEDILKDDRATPKLSPNALPSSLKMMTPTAPS